MNKNASATIGYGESLPLVDQRVSTLSAAAVTVCIVSPTGPSVGRHMGLRRHAIVHLLGVHL